MSCFVCVEYQGLHRKCKIGICIKNGSESFSCDHYQYDSELEIGDTSK